MASEAQYLEAMNAPIKRHCTGITQGRQCSCGAWHTAYSKPEEEEFLQAENVLAACLRYGIVALAAWVAVMFAGEALYQYLCGALG